jgi:hypothetical protein
MTRHQIVDGASEVARTAAGIAGGRAALRKQEQAGASKEVSV